MDIIHELNQFLLRYSGKGRTEDYHRMLSTVSEGTPSYGLMYADHLRSLGLGAHADVIEHAVRTNGDGVVRMPVAGDDRQLKPGQWRATVGPFGSAKDHVITLTQRSLTHPDLLLGWAAPYPMVDDAGQAARNLRDEGTTPQVAHVEDRHVARLTGEYGLSDPPPTGDKDAANWWKGE